MTIEITHGLSKIELTSLDPAHRLPAEGIKWSHIVVHHSGAEEKDAEQIRRYHKSLGWVDIGYNFVVERDGRVVVGRSTALPGAHCIADGMNHKALSVVVIGDFTLREPTAAQAKSLGTLLVELMAKYRIAQQNVLTHKEVRGAVTTCPGRMFSRSLLNPLRLMINDAVCDVPLRMVNNGTRTEMFVDGKWVGVRSVLQALGASVEYRASDRVVKVILR